MNDKPSPGASTAFLTSLRASRHYSDRPVSDDDVLAILEAGRWTGSSRNTQPWQIIVVREKTTREQLSLLGSTAYFADAQLVIAPIIKRAAQDSRDFDLGRMVQTLLLGAHARGLASSMGSFYPEEACLEAARLMDVPETWKVQHGIAVGWPLQRYDPPRPGVPSGRKPLSELVHYERFGRR